MKTSRITSHTLVPIGLAVIVIGGGAGWMTKINVAVDAHAARIKEATESEESRYKELTDILRQIDRRLSGIEGEMRRIRK
jgi:hypothetical protein